MKPASNGRDNSSLRVVHVVLQLDMGGLEKLLVEFARQASQTRSRLGFVSLGSRGTLANEIERCGWSVVALDKPPGFCLGLIPRLTRLLRSWRADVVHTHNNGALIYGTVAARLARIPCVVHTRHGPGAPLSMNEKLGAFRLAARLTDRFVCVSRDTQRVSIEQGVPQARTCVIHNGVDLARFQYVGPKTGGPAVLVSRLSPEKDVETLLHAVAIIKRQQRHVRLEIAGDGACLGPLRQLQQQLGLHDEVRFLGMLLDIRPLLARSALVVLPSVREGLSLMLLEAMASGLPVVATRVGGNPEIVINGKTGYLVPSGAPELLAEKMLDVLGNEALSRQMGLAGRQRVEEQFSIQQMVAHYEHTYREVLGVGDRPVTETFDVFTR
jgi:sugar transferase (PEP-CTERM/EpsH1 system associated)